MDNSIQLTRRKFLECDYNYNSDQEDHYGYSSIMSHLEKNSKEMICQGRADLSEIFKLFARVASMVLKPHSINEPFSAYFQDIQAGRRSTAPEDFSKSELMFFEGILNDINEPWLKSRLADLLWLLNRPRKIEHAKIAIDSYTSLPINTETWICDVDKCWERAARLCIQIKNHAKLNEIKEALLSAFHLEYTTDHFMPLRIAELLDKLRIDNDFISDIASSLQKIAISLQEQGEFYPARTYFELSSKKHKQCNNEVDWLKSLVAIATCFELEADSRLGNSNMVANTFYEQAIQAYRQIPTKYRCEYGIEEKIKLIRIKIAETGKASLDEMGMVHTSGFDISNMVQESIKHVTGKRSVEEALVYFTGLYRGARYKNLEENAKEIIKNNPLSNLFGSTHMSFDGRVVAKTPAMSFSTGEDNAANKSVLYRQILQQYSIEVQLVVEGNILPALRQLLMEHRFSKEHMISICQHSPLVPQGRELLLGHALWLGFDYDFGSAIHLLCPQLENIVRTILKNAGAHTSNIDIEGIENENGLSTLMDLPEALQHFGEDLTFEIKSIFTDSLGFNLRNEVAHGLLDDDSSSSIESIYAWWMVLKLVIRSILNNSYNN